jgi:outer membrane protein
MSVQMRPLCVLLLASTAVASQSPSPALALADVLAKYQQLAIESNLGLRNEDLQVEGSEAALDAARARFFPELALTARYTWADGGRDIEFPIGQIINPAYQTLNELLVAQGAPPRFAPIEGVSFAFQRSREQDTRMTLRQPLYQPAIPAAVAAQQARLISAREGRSAFSLRLRRDVTIGYLRYLQARRTVGIVQASVELLNENQRVNESLLRNGKVTQDQLLRARAELLAAQQQRRDADNSVSQARSYLNFLLNRSLDAPLDDAADETLETGPVEVRPATLVQLRADAVERRPELRQLAAAANAAQAQVRIAKAALKPSLSLGVDAGSQGTEYRFGPGYNFVAASLLLNWKFFDGGANRAELAQARIAERQAQLRRDESQLQVQLEVQQAADQLSATVDSLATAQAREEAAAAGFRIASRKRDEGVISQVEFIDARSTLTGAQLNLNLTRFELLARRAELQYASGSAGDRQ